ncbi:ATP-dependent RNA helicase-like protein [Emericellopsis cladophorae]|uniref:ATP-dependent RNA helicase n=1 Tax=Emericellopsis cladophorae TaxID=2686198 RepID=A0A9Q0BC30_9HYPO|nr:ATP-dependent RNA helicase-like protein [Emericellopsis cladophorae]KAI6778669.1 ATP-dependent RNA helicase-like protein [Emericellopsis cladophorae]
MGPQTKKRKLQSSAPATSNASKRPKNAKRHPKSKPAPPPRRAVDPSALAWQTVDEDEFGGLQVIENVEVVNKDGKLQFLIGDSKRKTEASPNSKSKAASASSDKPAVAATTNDDAEDQSFEGFGDEAMEGQDEHSGETGDPEDGLADQNSDEQPKKKKKKETKGKTHTDDEQLASSKKGNVFSALVDGEEPEVSEEEDEVVGVSTKAWEKMNLSPETLTALSKLGFAKPTSIQERSIPEVIKGADVIGKAQTGSGKTLAFGIPIVEKWLKQESKQGPMALVLSPTRELAKQIGDHIKALCDGLPEAKPFVCVITGGLSIQKQQRQLAKADIVIGTPGRLWEVMEGDAKLQDTLTRISFLVVDEADRLFKAGQFKEAEDIIGALDRRDPEAASDDESEDDDEDDPATPRQTLVFSATFDKDLQSKLAGKKLGKKREGDDQMEYLMKSLKFRSTPSFIDANPVRQMAEGLKEGLVECGAMEKDLYLYTVLLLNPKKRTLVFTNSISAVRRLTPFLVNLQQNALPLHSQMPQKARLRSLERFTEAKKPSILVATDVAARGLDIPEVDTVLHYHVPRAADTYVHRSGRTARGERNGVSVLLCAPDEVLPTRRLAGKVHAKASREHVIQTLPIDRKLASRLKSRVAPAKQLADATLAKEKARSNDSFMKNAAEDLGVEYDEDDLPEMGYSGRGGGRKKKEATAREMTKQEMGILRAKLREDLAQRVNLGVSERYITGGRVDVAALLREREKGEGGIFLGGEGLGLGFA